MTNDHRRQHHRNGAELKHLPRRNRYALALGLFGVIGTFALKWDDTAVYIIAAISYLLILSALFIALDEPES